MRTDPFYHTYPCVLDAVMNDGVEEANERTGRKVTSLPGGFTFQLDLSDGLLPLPGVRRVYPHVAAAEQAWFMSGSPSLGLLERLGVKHLWEPFADEGGTVPGAYGHHWRHHFDRDQLLCAIRALVADPSTRRVWVSAWDPSSDGLDARDQKSVPCPVGFTLSIVGDELQSTLMIRSSDVMVGLPYDVMGHALLMQVVRNTIRHHRAHYDPALVQDQGPSLGVMQVCLAHPHVYDVHYDDLTAAFDALDPKDAWPGQPLPHHFLSNVTGFPASYVAHVKAQYRDVPQPEFRAKMELVV